MVDGASFHEHPDDDAEEPADLGHDLLILRPMHEPLERRLGGTDEAETPGEMKAATPDSALRD